MRSQGLQSWFMKNAFLRTAISNVMLTVLCCVLLMVNVCRFALWLAFRMWILLITKAKYFGSRYILKFSFNMCCYFVPFCYNVPKFWVCRCENVCCWLAHVLLWSLLSYLLTHFLFNYLLTQPLTHLITYLLTFLLNYLLARSLTYLLTYSLTHSLTYFLNYFFT